MKYATLFWTFIFLMILLSTQIFQLFDIPIQNNLYFGLPLWIWYFIGIHFILVIALYFFSKNYLNEGAE